MSLESALEEERLEILKLLERPQNQRAPSQSGAQSTPSSPRQRYSSLTGSSLTGSAASPPPGRHHVTSLFDSVPEYPPSSGRSSGRNSGAASPVFFNGPTSGNGIHRTRSEASSNPPPRLLGQRGPDPNAAYNFNMYAPMASGTGLPRKKQGSKAVNGPTGTGRSSSPFANHAHRTQSPVGAAGRLSSPPPQQVESKNKLVTEHGQLIDLEYAYSKLSDTAMASSGGVLRSLPERAPMTDEHGQHIRAGSGESLTTNGGVRLQKDIDPDETAIADSTDDSSDDNSGDGDSDSDEEGRGRPGARETPSMIPSGDIESRGNSSERDAIVPDLMDQPKGAKGRPVKKKKRKNMSLLAAAEEERKQVSSKSKYKVRSLLPSISVTPSNIPGSNSPTTARRTGVHPSTNFDVHSTNSTPVSSDQEADDIDIRRAQRMETSISPIISNPESQRVIRTILRGDYASFHKEAQEGKRRARKYLVATDLSSEAQYSMEWTIGTVLRDGDTLMAIYAADQESVEDGAKPVSESSIGDALNEINSQAKATAMGSLTPVSHVPGTSSPLAHKDSFLESSRERTKAERERYIAAEAITGIISKLLKKTKLQIKVVLEVIHCKSPKHLLIEIIDLCEPTLVILGSRGRSALKGVLLGSFSNYLVTKSSVPVMVARKKLKHTKKYQHTNVRFTNNLTSNTARILANAKVD